MNNRFSYKSFEWNQKISDNSLGIPLLSIGKGVKVIAKIEKAQNAVCDFLTLFVKGTNGVKEISLEERVHIEGLPEEVLVPVSVLIFARAMIPLMDVNEGAIALQEGRSVFAVREDIFPPHLFGYGYCMLEVENPQQSITLDMFHHAGRLCIEKATEFVGRN